VLDDKLDVDGGRVSDLFVVLVMMGLNPLMQDVYYIRRKIK